MIRVNIIRNTSFKNAKITQIVSFDSEFDFNQNLKELMEILKNTEYFSDSSPSFKNFSENIYDYEYAKKSSEKLLVLESKIELSEIILKSEGYLINEIAELNSEEQSKLKEEFESNKKILEQLCSDSVDIILCFDSCGIHSVRFDFNLEIIETPELIKMLDFTCCLIDDPFFSFLKEDLCANGIISNGLLYEHMTYSIISSTNAYINPIEKEREILGISWKKEDYEYVNKNILEEITKNDIAIHKGDILTITTQSVFMVFIDLPDEFYNEYVVERIKAIEVFWRQKLLLKKMHFKLDDFIANVKKMKEEIGLESAIKEIYNMQTTIQLELEVYRNTIISVTHSYSMLFDTLNDVFKTRIHYDFVQEKLDTCKSIYEGLNEERRNNLMENIQWIVIIIGLATIILSFLVDVIYGSISRNKALNIFSILYIFISVGFIFILVRNKQKE